jgi:ketol-acid reductoisomerase
MAIIDFGGTKEDVTMRNEFPMERAQELLKNEIIAVIGYGVQGPGQSLNLKDNGFNVIIGQSKKFMEDWNRAEKDGWKPGEDLFEIEEAVQRGTIIELLVADAAHKAVWPLIRRGLNPGDALFFSHGFSIVYKDQTEVIPPEDIDVIMVAPKGSGTSLRRNFLSGEGINASFAVHQDATGRARERCIALGIGIGSGYLFPTTFEKEVYSDLVGERGMLMGALAGVMEAQYDTLRKRGHRPSEAFNETVEELTESLIRLVGENGMDWMYANCSATAQRGALDWKPRFKKAVIPVFKELYDKVASGDETRRVISANSSENYKEQLRKELDQIANSEMWQAGKATRSLRPRGQAKEGFESAKGTIGRKSN